MAKDKSPDWDSPQGGGKKSAGMDRLPDALREAGAKAAELAQNPIARSMLAAGLVTAAAALTSSSKVRSGVREATRDALDSADAAADSAGKIGAAIVTAATEAVRRFMASSGAGDNEPQAAASTPKRSGTTRAKPGAKRASAKSGTKAAGSKSPKASAPKSAAASSRKPPSKASAAKGGRKSGTKSPRGGGSGATSS